MKQFNIPVEVALEIIVGKWKVIILCHLTKGTKWTSELQRLIPEISIKMRTQQLRELEEDGVITRKIYKQIPPWVEYSLTDYGWSLQNVLNLLTAWGEQCIDRRNTKFKWKFLYEIPKTPPDDKVVFSVSNF